MNRTRCLSLVPAAFALLLGPSALGQEDPRAVTRQAIESYVTAYNAHDAAAVAAQFAPDAETVRIRGDQVQRRSGRAEIQEDFAQVFSQSPDIKLKLVSESARMVTPDVYVGDGTWEVTGSSPNEPTKGRYTVVRRKVDGRWQIECGYTFAPQSSAAD